MRPDTLIIGHTEFLVIITTIIITIGINWVFRLIFYLVNRSCTKKTETAKKSNWRRLKIKLTKILISKTIAGLVMALLMASSLALVAVSTIMTTKTADLDKDSAEILGSNCKVKFDSGIDFLIVSSITCPSVQKSHVIYFPTQNLLNETQCLSNIKNEEVLDLLYSPDETIAVVPDDSNTATGRFDFDSIQFYSINLKNQTSNYPSVIIFPAGFGKWENIVFISLMISISLFLVGLVLFYRNPAKPAKPPPKKISLHSTKQTHFEMRQNLDIQDCSSHGI